MREKGFRRRLLNKRLKLVQIPYRTLPKDFPEICAQKAIDEVRKSLEEKDRLKG